ncbi:MAG: flagellar hook-length control protein FliK [Alcaligenaceae bacterium]|nr:flagellar hook-length control protein FliK [Alcaligenaceae bacterium]
MSVSGPSPLGTLMVQRVEGTMGVNVAQQANITTGARPDAVTQPGQPDKTDAAKNLPPKEQEAARQPQGRQSGLAALARNDPEIARLLAARNAPMTAYTASAPTTLGQTAKTILALFQLFPDARPAVTGRTPLLSHAPGQQAATGQNAAAAPGAAGGTTAANPAAGNLDPRAVEALMQRAAGGGQASTQLATAMARAATATATPAPGAPGQPVAAGPLGSLAQILTAGGLPLASSGMAGQLAHALSQAMQGSGLFYESHLRDFAFGQRTLAQMQNEPQAQAGRESGGQQSSAAQARGGSETAANPAQSGNQAAQTQTAAQTAQTAQTAAQLSGALLGMDPSTHALVRQQLETLANQTFAWQGEAWPGGDLEWEVKRREPQEGGEETEHWSTRLKLTLPGLGEVVARLSLSETQLAMHLAAPEAASLMADHTGMLRERLGQHGLQLSQLTISRESEKNGGQS